MKKLSIILLLSLFIQGCASLPTPEKMANETQGYNLPFSSNKDMATVFVVRPSALGALIKFNVFLDDKLDDSEMGYTKSTQHIFFSVKPGKHMILSKAENWAEVEIDVKAGETVYIEQEVSMGFIMARNSLKLLDQVTGKYHMMKTGTGKIIKTTK